jgi:hypothetical protein
MPEMDVKTGEVVMPYCGVEWENPSQVMVLRETKHLKSKTRVLVLPSLLPCCVHYTGALPSPVSIFLTQVHFTFIKSVVSGYVHLKIDSLSGKPGAFPWT